MSKRALELLEQDAPATDESAPAPTPAKQAIAMLEGTADPPTLSPEAERASKRKALVERARRGEDISAEEAGVGYQPPAATPYEGGIAPLSPLLMPAKAARAVGDVALSTVRGIVRPAAATAAGVWGAMSPNTTYEEARASAEESQRRGEGIFGEPGARTPEGHALEEGIGRAMYYTGIPAAVEHGLGYLESKTNRMTRDIVGTVGELLTLRGGAGAAEGAAARTVEGSAAREGVRLGTDAGAASAAIDLSKARPALREAIESAAKADGVNPDAVVRQLEADQLGLPGLTRGQATRDAGELSREQNARGRHDALRQRFEQQNTAMIDKLDDLRFDASPQVVGNDAVQNGQSLIDAYKELDLSAKADIASTYKALTDANGGAMPVDGPTFVSNAEAALKSSRKGYWLPAEVRSLMDDFKAGPMTFDDFETLRTVLATEARNAKNGNVKAAVGAVRQALEELPGVPENLKALADEARGKAKARFDRLDADPAYSAAADDLADGVKVGQASALADDFVQKHVVRGRAANVQRMRETLSDNPLATETISAGAMNYLKQKAGIDAYRNDGNFSQAGYNKALAELMPKLPEMVGQDMTEQLQLLGRYAHSTQFQPRGSFVNNSNTFTAAAAEKAADVVTAAVDAKTLGGGSAIRRAINRRGERKWVEGALEPGAGVRLNTLLKKPKP